MPTEFLRAEWFCEGRGYCHPLCGRHELLRLITRQIRVGGMMVGMTDEKIGWVATIWRIQLSSRFKLYDPEAAVIEVLRKTYQIEALG